VGGSDGGDEFRDDVASPPRDSTVLPLVTRLAVAWVSGVLIHASSLTSPPSSRGSSAGINHNVFSSPTPFSLECFFAPSTCSLAILVSFAPLFVSSLESPFLPFHLFFLRFLPFGVFPLLHIHSDFQLSTSLASSSFDFTTTTTILLAATSRVLIVRLHDTARTFSPPTSASSAHTSARIQFLPYTCTFFLVRLFP